MTRRRESGVRARTRAAEGPHRRHHRRRRRRHRRRHRPPVPGGGRARRSSATPTRAGSRRRGRRSPRSSAPARSPRCPATSPTRTRSQALFDARRRSARRPRRRRQQRRPRRHRQPRRHDRRAVVAGPRRHAERHLPLHPRRPARRSGAAGRGGVIVNNASVVGWRAQAGQAHYAAAKAGVMALTRCAAIEARRVRRAGQRGRPEPRHAPAPGEGHHAPSCWPS